MLIFFISMKSTWSKLHQVHKTCNLKHKNSLYMDHKYYILMSVRHINQEAPFHATISTNGSRLSHDYKHSVRNSVNKKRGRRTVFHFLAAISSFHLASPLRSLRVFRSASVPKIWIDPFIQQPAFVPQICGEI